MTIPSTTYPIEGDYNILWSATSTFEDGKTIIIKSGTAARGTYTVVDSFAIPEATSGVHYIGFFRLGREEQPTILSFNVQPHLKIQPISGAPGTTITIYGTGFPAGDTGSITFDGKQIGGNVTADENGGFVVDFTIPSISAAQHQIIARSARLGTSVEQATLTVVPAITVAPQTLQSGVKATITGRGFAADSSMSIQFNGLAVADSPSTDDTGNFTYSFTLPQTSENGYRFVAADQAGNTAILSSTGGDKPPAPSPPPSTPKPPSTPQTPQKPGSMNGAVPKPTAVEPKGQRFGVFGTQSVNFAWEQVSAPGGVTYTLEVAENYTFSEVKPGMSASGLTQTNYTLKLEPGTYFWRVKAVDTSGNESEWANSLYTFNVGLFPAWVLAIAAVIYIVALYLLVRALLRRRNRYNYY